MKRIHCLTVMSIFLLAGVLSAAGRGVALGAPQVVEAAFSFPEPVVAQADDGFSRLTLGSFPLLTEVGLPALPYRFVRLLLPPQGVIQDLSVSAEEERWLDGKLVPEPAQPQSPISMEAAHAPALPNPEAYETGGYWPPERYQVLSEQRLDGYRLLLLRLFPLRYQPGRQTLSYAPAMRVVVRLAGAEPGEEPSTASPADARTRARLTELVDNPQDVARFGRLAPRTHPQLALSSGLIDPAQPCDYIIITSHTLRAAFEPLAAWRRGQGLAVGIFEIEDIIAAYDGTRPAGGSDDATRLRNFLIDAHQTWLDTSHPLGYVLLGGDTEIIPARTVYVRAGVYETDESHPMVSDAYYAGLDGDWDADHDGLYGEGGVSGGGSGQAGEEADLYAELYVGRAPVNELESEPRDLDVTNWASKVLRYEDNPQAADLNRGLWLGEQLDAKTFGDDSKELILAAAPELEVERLYDSIKAWSAGDLATRLSAGVHIVNHLGHANSGHVLRMSESDVALLTNEQPFLVHSQGCLAAAIATQSGEAIAEAFVTAEHGAFAFVGNTNYGWYMPGSTRGASQVFDLAFFRALYQSGITHLGRALQQAKEDALDLVGAVGPERWVYLELILLGDPYTPIATAYPAPVARISSPSRATPLAGTIQITGSAHAGTAQGALFSGYQVLYGAGSSPKEWVAIGLTVTQPITHGVLGTWDVGLLPDGLYALRLRVSNGTGLETIDDLVVQVDHTLISSPPSQSYLRAGEMIPVQGTASRADLLRYSLDVGYGVAPQQWTSLISSTTSVISDTLALWDTRNAVEAGTYTLRLTVEGTDYQGEDRISVNLDPLYHPGWPRTIANRLSNESLAVGDLDGDGQIEVVAAEGMRNCGGALEGGRCGAYGMLLYVWDAQGKLRPGWPQMPGSDNRLTSPTLADLDGNGSLEIIVASIDGSVYAYRYDGLELQGWPQRTGGEIYGAPACADLDGDGRPEVVVCNAQGMVYAWRGDGSLLPGWPQGAGGSADVPLLADLDGDGKVEVIVAAASGRVTIWRGDGGLYAGWPVYVEGSLAAAPVAGDLDRDGSLEIVVLSDRAAYAWKTSGQLAKGWPVTNWPGSAGSSPALADLDGDGRLEIIATAQGSGVYVWHGDGQSMEGWLPTESGLEVSQSSPVVGDITGDDRPEVIVVSGDAYHEVYALSQDGSLVKGWPRRIPKREVPYPYWDRRTSGTLVDLDGDGKLELGLGVEAYVYFWDTLGSASATELWPTFHGNMQRSGALPPQPAARQYWPILHNVARRGADSGTNTSSHLP